MATISAFATSPRMLSITCRRQGDFSRPAPCATVNVIDNMMSARSSGRCEEEGERCPSHGPDDRRLSRMGHGAAGARLRPQEAVARRRQGRLSRRGGAARRARSPPAANSAPPRALIDRCPKLEIISCYGVGVDAIDLERARARGVRVTNTPDVLTEDVADFAFALILAHMRKVIDGDAHVRSGAWRAGSLPLGVEPPRQDARHSRFRAHRPRDRPARRRLRRDDRLFRRRAGGRRPPRLLSRPRSNWPRRATSSSPPCPGAKRRAGLVNAAVFEALGPQGLFVNVARGSVVDEAALIDALAREADRRRGARRVPERAEHRPASAGVRSGHRPAAPIERHGRDPQGDGQARARQSRGPFRRAPAADARRLRRGHCSCAPSSPTPPRTCGSRRPPSRRSVPRTSASASPSAASAAPTSTITTTAASAPCGCASR